MRDTMPRKRGKLWQGMEQAQYGLPQDREVEHFARSFVFSGMKSLRDALRLAVRTLRRERGSP
jgi:hypothetical protein